MGGRAATLAQPRLQRHRPRGVDPRAERRQDAQPPVADLVAEPLDHHGGVARHRPGRVDLVSEVPHQVHGGPLVERRLLAEPREGAVRPRRHELTRELPDLTPELHRAADALALPERHGAGNARRGGHQHAVAGDLLDPPRRGTEHERLPGPRLVHHLLVQLAHACVAVDEVHPVEPAIGDCARVLHGELARAAAAADRAVGAVPHDPGRELGELVARIPAGQHVEHPVELLARELGERVRAPREGKQVVHAPRVVRHGGDDLLGQHVERQPGHTRLFDRGLAHPRHDRGAFQEVAAVLREDPPAARAADLVPGSAHALDAARHAAGALHLDHEVDGAHVDSQLEAARGDERGQPASLERLLDDHPLLRGEAPMVGAGNLRIGQLVQAEREALGQAPVVHEDQGRPVGADQLEHRRIHRRPDGLARSGVTGHRERIVVHRRTGVGQVAHVLDRHDHLEVELLALACVDDCHRAGGTGVVVAAEEPGDLLERSLRGREADPLQRAVDGAFQPLEAERQVRAALRRGDGVDLVDDHGARGLEHLDAPRGEQQVEALRSGDEDVGRLAQHACAVALRRVTRAHRNGQLGKLEPLPSGRVGESGEGAAEVALDVVVQRLERRDVEQARCGLPAQALFDEGVQPPEERGEGLARPGRCDDQGVLPGRDRRPAEPLGVGRRGERAREPVRDERVERGRAGGGGRHPWIVAVATRIPSGAAGRRARPATAPRARRSRLLRPRRSS